MLPSGLSYTDLAEEVAALGSHASLLMAHSIGKGSNVEQIVPSPRGCDRKRELPGTKAPKQRSQRLCSSRTWPSYPRDPGPRSASRVTQAERQVLSGHS
jgi:hypothetical protein